MTTKAKMWTAVAGGAATAIAALPLSELPGWAAALATAALGALTALGVYRVPNKDLPR